MLEWASIFLVAAIMATLFGSGSGAAGAADIARVPSHAAALLAVLPFVHVARRA